MITRTLFLAGLLGSLSALFAESSAPAAQAAPAAAVAAPVAAPAHADAAAVPVRKLGVAVLDLDVQGIGAEMKGILSDQFRSEMISTGRFEVMERGQMDDIMKEQGFQQSGACSDEACLVQMGQVLGVDRMAAGTVGKLGKLTLINIRLIDIQTGRIIQTVSQDCKCEVENLPLALKVVAKKLAGMETAEDLKALQQVADQSREEKRQEEAKKTAGVQTMDKQEKGNPTAAYIALGVLVAGGGTAAYFLLGKGGDEKKLPDEPPPGNELPLPPMLPAQN